MVKVMKRYRHVRWNWEESLDNSDMVRYHFVIVDDKCRKMKMEKIINSMKSKISVNYSFEKIRSVEGKVGGTEFRYLFESFDTLHSPSLLEMNSLFKNNFRDLDLYERKKRNIEDYIADQYK